MLFASFLQLNNSTLKRPSNIDLLNKFSSFDIIYRQAFSFLAAFSPRNSFKTNHATLNLFVFVALKNPLLLDHESFLGCQEKKAP